MNLEVSNFNYGGQAVIEGVMMRGRRYWAVAVRKANKEIIVKDGPVTSVTQKYPILGKPLIRGSVALVEALVFGIKCLTFSANAYAEEETGEELSVKELVFTFGLAIVLTVGFFVVLPAFIIRLIQGAIGSNVLLNLAEGLIKISFFIAYIAGISLMKDIQRVFQYHGAEHRTINCYEAGEELTVANVQKHSSIHPRLWDEFHFDHPVHEHSCLFLFRQASVSPQGAGASGDSAGCGRLVLRSDSAGGNSAPIRCSNGSPRPAWRCST